MADSDSEEDTNVLSRLIKGYRDGSRLTGDGSGDAEDDESLRELLSEKLQTGRFGCLICLDPIGRPEAVWSCVGCYETYHLNCIQSWSHQALQLADLNQDPNVCWACPKCRREYGRTERPGAYYCFCGKERDPKSTPWVAAHSCDQVCGRKLAACGHQCRIMCHPGPCPPCPIVVTTSCYCGSSKPMGRRCGNQGWTCSQPCGRTLTCGKHKCQAKCHDGECDVCSLTQQRACVCGESRRTQPCADSEWHCDRVCDKILDCGTHKCQSVCHSDVCAPCIRPGQDTCPCGAQSYAGHGHLDCVDQLPCCGGTCSKTLECGLHQCYEQCHKGDCPKCRTPVTKLCRCGAKELRATCGASVTCDVKCVRQRQCTRHKCNRKCCDGNCAPCEQTCGRQLNCDRHRCAAPCHRGACYPCTLTANIACPCGATSITVPCGVAKRTKPPKCTALCKKPSICHHESQAKHRCHAGDCPPCKQPCQKPLTCGHVCISPCHSAVPVDVVNAEKAKPQHKLGFWDIQAAKFEIKDLPCPPCATRIQVTCIGEHETCEMKCSERREYSCGQSCGRVLTCGNHACSKPCHKKSANISESCEECHSMCNLTRPEGCSHACPQPCHPPPCKPCKYGLKVTCMCGVNELVVPCHKWQACTTAQRQAQQQCGNQCPRLLVCGHQCRKTCHREGECSPRAECHKRVTVTCPCKRKHAKAICSTLKGDSTETLQCDAECEQAKLEKRNYETQMSTESNKSNGATSNEQSPVTTGKRRNRRKRTFSDEDEKKTLVDMVKDNKLIIVGVVVLVIGLVAGWMLVD